jgi:hypothetical protein
VSGRGAQPTAGSAPTWIPRFTAGAGHDRVEQQDPAPLRWAMMILLLGVSPTAAVEMQYFSLCERTLAKPATASSLASLIS